MTTLTQKIHEKMTYSGTNKFDPLFYVDGNVPHMAYDGLSICQHYGIVDPFLNLFDNTRPSRIIEIGTAAGGLTLLLRDILDLVGLTTTTFITYDVIDSPLKSKIKENNKNITFYQKDLFSGDYQKLIEEDYIKEQIQGEGTTILLCDGGCKSREFNLLSHLLKPGDIIMAHDYAVDAETFSQKILNKIWYWHEIKYADIEGSCQAFNLVPFMADDFEKVVWACFRKV